MQSCKERIREVYKERIEDLKKLWEAYLSGEEEVEDLGSIYEYGLAFDYVKWKPEEPGYFRYQLSWGGPADEFRFYTDATLVPYRIEYWFLDWFDGASIELKGEDFQLLLDIFLWFKEGGAVKEAFY